MYTFPHTAARGWLGDVSKFCTLQIEQNPAFFTDKGQLPLTTVIQMSIKFDINERERDCRSFATQVGVFCILIVTGNGRARYLRVKCNCKNRDCYS